MPAQFLDFSIYVILALTSVSLIAAGVVVLSAEARMSRRLRDVQTDSDGLPEDSVFAKTLSGLLLLPGKDREEVEQYLAAAGYRDPRAPMVFGLIRVFAILAVGGGIYAAARVMDQTPALTIMFTVMGGCVAYLAPKMLLRMDSSRRKRKVQAELPFTLDVLVMMLEAGVSIDQCFRAFAGGEGRAAPLTQETVIALVRDLDIGSPYDLALKRWAERLGVPGAQELARVIQQALGQGTPLVQVLKEFAKEFAERRVATAREAVGKMTTKMTVVMVLFILPALLIVLAGPAVATLGSTLRNLSQ